MTYFPKPSEMKFECPGCGGWFQPGGGSCLVMHSPGTCCHLYDIAVPAPLTSWMMSWTSKVWHPEASVKVKAT